MRNRKFKASKRFMSLTLLSLLQLNLLMANDATASSGSLNSSTTTYSASDTTITYGSSVTLTATVTSSATGTVTFKDSSDNTLCTTGMLSGRNANCSWTPASVATFSVRAVYGGDSRYYGSSSSAANVVVSKATPTITNFTVPSLTVNSPASLSATSSVAGAFTFKAAGSTISGCSSVTTVSLIATCSYTPTGTSAVSFTLDFVPTNTANYTSLTAQNSTSATPGKATSTTVISCSNQTYTGSARTPCTATVTRPGASSTTTTVSYSNNINAGMARANAIYAGDSNYEGSTAEEVTFTIGGAASTTVITCSNQSYTGTALTPCTATVSGPGGLSTTATVTYSNNTNVGTATANAVYAGEGNYQGSTAAQVTFAIGKATSTTIITCSNQIYTGTALTPCTAAVTGPGGLNTTTTVNYTSNTNYGTATANASYSGDGNYEGSIAATVTFTISRGIAFNPSGSEYTAGSTVKVSLVGGTSSKVTFSTVTEGCRIIGVNLTSTKPNVCRISAKQDTSTTTADATFILATQSTLRISNKTATIKPGKTRILTTVGGTSRGAVSYNYVSGPCTINNGDEITADSVGNCVVTATKAGTAMYAPITSAPFTFKIK